MAQTHTAGRLVVLSGPSGVGKGTVVAALRQRRPDLNVSTSATTRPQRAHEQQGAQYHFLSRDEFDALIAQDGFLEWAEFNGNRYGTPLAPVQQALAEGQTILLEIEVQGARQIRRLVPQAEMIFLLPPDLDELERRLKGRGTESAEDVVKRLGIASEEMSAIEDFDHVVVNHVVDEAVEQIVRILNAPPVHRG